MSAQLPLVPRLIEQLQGRPVAQQNTMLRLLLPLLGSVEMPTDPKAKEQLFGLRQVWKSLPQAVVNVRAVSPCSMLTRGAGHSSVQPRVRLGTWYDSGANGNWGFTPKPSIHGVCLHYCQILTILHPPLLNLSQKPETRGLLERYFLDVLLCDYGAHEAYKALAAGQAAPEGM